MVVKYELISAATLDQIKENIYNISQKIDS